MSVPAVPILAPMMLAVGASPGLTAPRDVSEVIVTAAPYAVSADSLASHVEVVSAAALQTAAPGGIGDLLAGRPGLRSSAFGPGASRPIVRGLAGPRVMVLQNGLGQVDASDVSPDHAVASDPSEASRVEVLRGPSTLAYGGSAVGGVVNIIDDRIPSAPAAGRVDGRLSLSGSTVDKGASASGAIKAGQGPWVVSLQGARRESGDYDTPAPPTAASLGQPTDRRVQENSAVRLSSYGGGVAYIGQEGSIGVSARQTHSVYGIPFPQLEGEPAGGDEGPVQIHLRQTRYDLRGEHQIDLGPFDRVKLSGGYADYAHAEVSALSGEVGTRFLSTGYEGRLDLVQVQRGGWKGAVGVQGLHRDLSAEGDEAFIPPTRIAEAAAYTLQRYDTEAWGVEGGLRLDRRTLTTPDDKRSFNGVSASAAVLWRPAAPWFLSLAYARNQRAPSEVELFADGPHAGTGAYEIGERGLGAETVNSLEATARYAAGRLRLEAHLYQARFDGYIEERRTGQVEDGLPVYRFTAADARFTGGELEAAYDLWIQGERRLTLSAAYDAVRGQADEGNLARIPPPSITGKLEYAAPRWEASAEVRRVDRQDRLADQETPTPGYTLVNLFASVKPLADPDIKLFAELRNLTDATAREHVSFLKDVVVQPARNLRVGLAYDF